MSASAIPRVTQRTTPPRFSGARVAVYGVLVGLSALYLMPLVWMVATSLKTTPQAVVSPPVWIPSPIVLQNYPDALTKIDFANSLKNSLIYAVPCVILSVISCSLVAYGFARVRWPGRDRRRSPVMALVRGGESAQRRRTTISAVLLPSSRRS